MAIHMIKKWTDRCYAIHTIAKHTTTQTNSTVEELPLCGSDRAAFLRILKHNNTDLSGWQTPHAAGSSLWMNGSTSSVDEQKMIPQFYERCFKNSSTFL